VPKNAQIWSTGAALMRAPGGIISAKMSGHGRAGRRTVEERIVGIIAAPISCRRQTLGQGLSVVTYEEMR
jgi:hypothetical protein